VEPEVEAAAGPDPIVGRYLLSSTEGFDQYLKVLGVSMMRRKMANSVTPVNDVEISEDGNYICIERG
jgi:hypothetical protein